MRFEVRRLRTTLLPAVALMAGALIIASSTPPSSESHAAGLLSKADRVNLAVQPSSNGPAATNRVLVGFQKSVNPSQADDLHRQYGRGLLARLSQLNVDVVQVPDGTVASVIDQYKKDPRVKFAEPDFLGKASEVPNDSYFSQQWNMTKIYGPQAWDKTQGAATVKVAVLDSGIDPNHPDLQSKVGLTKNCTTTASLNDLVGHGTHVAGIAAAATNNGSGVAGMGHNTSLMIAKVLDDTNYGYYSWWACGMTWAADNGAKVINMSLVGSSASSTLQTAVDYAWSKGVVLVASAGNNGNTSAMYPAYYTNVIAVASTNSSDQLSSFSERGTWVDLAAPGESIYSTVPTYANNSGSTGYTWGSGTSMASPHVAGLAALVWANGATSATEVRNTLQSSADAIPGTGTNFYYGRINAARAVGATMLAATATATPKPTNTPVTGTATPTPTPKPRGKK